MDWFEILWTTSFWIAAVRIATPLIFGTLGELVCERAGVLNLGIEGIMTLGAMTGWMSVYMGADLWTGVILAAMVGSLLGALHSMLTCLLYTSPSPRDRQKSRMPSSA